MSFTSNGTQQFATPYASGAIYSVSINSQPTGENCVLGSNASGTITANTTVAVTCTASAFTIGGTINGYAGTGLVLQDNGGNNLTVNQGATSFTFAGTLAMGATYSVTVLTAAQHTPRKPAR